MDEQWQRPLRSGASYLFISSLLCGLCPGSCVIYLMAEREAWAPVLISICFIAVAVLAGVGEFRWARASSAGHRRPRASDFIAAVGLMLINLAAYLGVASRNSDVSEQIARVAGVGFALLCVTAYRAIGSGRLQRDILNEHVGFRRRGLFGLGIFKAIYETIWLGLCAAGCLLGPHNDAVLWFAFGAGYGLIGFAGVWLAMIIFHLIALLQLRAGLSAKRQRGFEVLPVA